MTNIRVPVPQIAASEERSTNTRLYELQDWFVEQVLGLASNLTDDILWTGTTSDIAAAVGNAQDQIYALMQEVEPMAGIQDVRISNAGLLEKKIDDTWYPAGDVDTIDSVIAETLGSAEDATATLEDGVLTIGIPHGAAGSTGAAGSNGENGLDGEDGQDGAAGNIANLVPQTDFNTDQTLDEFRCNIAAPLGQWLVDKYNDVLDQVDAYTDLAFAFDAVLVVFIPAYVVVDQIHDAISEAIEATTEAIRAWLDTDKIEEIKQSIFCAMNSKEFTADTWESIKVAIEAAGIGAPADLAFLAYLNMLEGTAIARRTSIYSNEMSDEALCEVWAGICPEEWEHRFEFNGDLEGWVDVHTEFISVTDGSTYTQESDGIASADCQLSGIGYWRLIGAIEFTFDSPVVLTEVEVRYTADLADEPFLQVQLNRSIYRNDTPSAGEHSFHASGAADVETVTVAASVDSDPSGYGGLSGYMKVLWITVKGTGVNPFV